MEDLLLAMQEAVQCILKASKERKWPDGSTTAAPLNLIEDVQHAIFQRMAYPISAWV